MGALDRPVSELMRREVVTLQQSDHLDLADDIMRLGRIRHLPVLEGERLVGILSSRDLLAASLSRALDFEPMQRRAFLRAVDVKEVMTPGVETARKDDRASAAAVRMLGLKVGCLPVVDAEGRFLGLLTETDLVAAVLEEEGEMIDVDEGGRRKHRFESELNELRRVRDELRVQMHLGKAEAEELWEKLEKRFHRAEAEVKKVAGRAEEPLQDVAEAAELLLDEIRNGYRRLREML